VLPVLNVELIHEFECEVERRLLGFDAVGVDEFGSDLGEIGIVNLVSIAVLCDRNSIAIRFPTILPAVR
jgi:hypothetical protein